MQLADVPQFTVRAVALVDDEWVLEGDFNHLNTVHEGRSWLYVSRTDSLIGDLERLDPASRCARFNTKDRTALPPWVIWHTFPWLDGYWDARDVALILDSEHTWQPVVFQASDALERRVPGWRALRSAVNRVPEADETLVPGGWDHEHCMLCNAHIDPCTTAYVEGEGNWLCVCARRTKPATHSGPRRPPIPEHAGHRFRLKPATRRPVPRG